MMNTKEDTIFIVDDDEQWSVKLEHLLRQLGYTNITWYPTGTDCINAMNKKPATVFLDFQMEDQDGLQVLQNIKHVSPDTDVVFCTSIEDISVAIQAIRFGSKDYLLKSNADHKELQRITQELKPI